MSARVWWHQFVPKGVIYDIGAHIGQTVREFAPLVEWVYAFEPNPKCFRELRQNTADLDNVRLFDCGISNTHGEQQVFTYRHWLLLPSDPNDLRYVNRDYHPGQRADLKGEFPVFFTTLDRLTHVLRPPDFIKVDVDGMEWSVVDGARESLRVRHPILYVEIGIHGMRTHGDDPEQIVRFLSECGYEFVLDITGDPLRATENIVLELADGVDRNVNVLCVPRGDARLAQWNAPPEDFC